jgi:hypothetical protein
MGGTNWSDGFSAVWAPIQDAGFLALMTPHTHWVRLFHDGEPVAWDVCGAADCETTANRLHIDAI